MGISQKLKSVVTRNFHRFTTGTLTQAAKNENPPLFIAILSPQSLRALKFQRPAPSV